jgi:hypothetical protein
MFCFGAGKGERWGCMEFVSMRERGKGKQKEETGMD